MGVKNGDGKYCIVMDADVSGSVEYYDTVLNKTVDYSFVVNGTAQQVTGKCFDAPIGNQTTETFNLHFFPNDITPATEFPNPDRWHIKLTFVAANAPDTFKIIDYQLKAIFYPEHFNASAPTTNHTVYYGKAPGSELEWGASEKHGFTCSTSELKLVNNSKVVFSGLKVLAFAILPTDQFPQNQLFEECQLDVRTSDLVPIIVGACLAGLVIIVLVAYLVGRARAKRQGYASV
jgi:lysosomal-associated membrane protein 1/2